MSSSDSFWQDAISKQTDNRTEREDIKRVNFEVMLVG